MLARGGVASINGSGRPQKSGRKDTRAKRLRLERPVGLLSEREFQAHFHIPDSNSIHLIDDEALFSAKQPHNATYFTKEQFIARLRLPLPSLFKQLLHFMQIPPAFLHPNVV